MKKFFNAIILIAYFFALPAQAKPTLLHDYGQADTPYYNGAWLSDNPRSYTIVLDKVSNVKLDNDGNTGTIFLIGNWALERSHAESGSSSRLIGFDKKGKILFNWSVSGYTSINKIFNSYKGNKILLSKGFFGQGSTILSATIYNLFSETNNYGDKPKIDHEFGIVREDACGMTDSGHIDGEKSFKIYIENAETSEYKYIEEKSSIRCQK